MYNLLVVAVLSYLIGSIPTSIIASKIKGGFDIRHHGSGNAGGTNVWRILGWKIGLAVMVFDMMKGAMVTYYVPQIFWSADLPFSNPTPLQDVTIVRIICGIAAILGHIWTLFAGFKGGKGVATGAGMLLGLAPVEFVVAMAVFGAVLGTSRYVSLGSISGALAFPITMLLRENIFNVDIQGYHTLIFFAIGTSLLLVYTHRENIKRLLAGTERKI
jgi:acyl phosphate:glycerol-3-phosphate acyltransferase